ncbi:hypothetical protein N4G41_03580 [Kosakonia sacchari]|uniref:hypothetical protein n=1 Tax=Kosakonia sacchari TaxID=1158459 RepID=UPI002ACDF3C5|nr:hypothetical protein [Kosakonia sacchari]MDZ7320709.1 hypothetical protein [Kosakonia sacchari]
MNNSISVTKTNNDELALKLEKLAQHAGADDWQAKQINGEPFVIRKGSYKAQNGFCTYQNIAQIDDKPSRDFVASASPKNILDLLAERDADKNVIKWLRQRIAELEARTVSVKWPDDGMSDCYDLWGAEHCRDNFDCGYNFSAVRHEQAIREALSDAGINLEVEE